MFDELFDRPHRKHIKDLNLVPVIDMFTTVLFFLLLSTSFFAFTKLTVPPAQVDTITQPLPVAPLSPKIILGSFKGGSQLRLILIWEGNQPGEITETVESDLPNATPEQIRKKANALVGAFLKNHPDEKSIRLSMTANTPYQYLISAMDGVRDHIQDVVLTSYEEAEAKWSKLQSGSGG